MHEIICPHCSKAFKIDEAGYADILKQVRDAILKSSCMSAWHWRSKRSSRPSNLPKATQPTSCCRLRPKRTPRSRSSRPGWTREMSHANCEGAVVTQPEAVWVVRRLAELLDWSQPDTMVNLVVDVG